MMVALVEAMLVGIPAAEGISKKDEPRCHRRDWSSSLLRKESTRIEGQCRIATGRLVNVSSVDRLWLDHGLDVVDTECR
jgi:hypothetical protein